VEVIEVQNPWVQLNFQRYTSQQQKVQFDKFFLSIFIDLFETIHEELIQIWQQMWTQQILILFSNTELLSQDDPTLKEEEGIV
jgi:hypothetical protein